jgi:hypothetical protein
MTSLQIRENEEKDPSTAYCEIRTTRSVEVYNGKNFVMETSEVVSNIPAKPKSTADLVCSCIVFHILITQELR